ncbi:hypothetical protein DV515_00006079, partial [Chloebia gouldiae]
MNGHIAIWRNVMSFCCGFGVIQAVEGHLRMEKASHKKQGQYEDCLCEVRAPCLNMKERDRVEESLLASPMPYRWKLMFLVLPSLGFSTATQRVLGPLYLSYFGDTGRIKVLYDS